MNQTMDIVSIGARTPLGLKADAAAAAVRAGISGLGEHPFMTDQVGDMTSGALDHELDPHIMGPGRLVALAEPALSEAVVPLEGRSANLQPIPVFMAAPELRPGFTDQDVHALQLGVTQMQGLPVELGKVNLFAEGHAGGFSALKAAVEHLTLRGGEVCLVGGVESYFHPDTMEWLDANRQLVGAVSRSGFVPGEGAGFFLLTSKQGQRKINMESILHLSSVAVGHETKLINTKDMCLGEGLTATVREALAGLYMSDQKIDEILCDINGERYRGEEWGFVCLRLSEYFDDPTAYRSPAEFWGDMGAASGPLFVMLSCRAAMRGYAPGSRTLLWASSEKGLRGAMVLDAPINR